VGSNPTSDNFLQYILLQLSLTNELYAQFLPQFYNNLHHFNLYKYFKMRCSINLFLSISQPQLIGGLGCSGGRGLIDTTGPCWPLLLLQLLSRRPSATTSIVLVMLLLLTMVCKQILIIFKALYFVQIFLIILN
jgi:hypothetical protein